jgi:hypothetical protein
LRDSHRAQAPDGGKLQKRSYDLDAKDFFWAKNAASPFPQVAEEIDAELTKCVPGQGLRRPSLH